MFFLRGRYIVLFFLYEKFLLVFGIYILVVMSVGLLFKVLRLLYVFESELFIGFGVINMDIIMLYIIYIIGVKYF